jgi:serine/threonine-protein kinase
MPTTEQLATALAGRYTIERQIGAGGMATVYLGHDVRHRRPVAVKFLNPELGAVVGAERFASEIELTANLQHPYILPLFDSGEASLPGYTPGHGLLFYVMPYVDGETLRQRLTRERQLSIDEAIRIARGVASALDYAHRHGVIHRDLKPENILLHDGEPLVADFGIALALSNAAGERITQSGISLGTPQYMSPEQAAGDRQLDARSDVYSLGTVLYEMLAGEPPHTGPTVQAVISKVISEPARPIEQLRHTVSEHVCEALARALAKVPADRFATAGEFAAALTLSLPTQQSAPRRVRHRRKSWITLVSIALLGATLGGAATRALWITTAGGAAPSVSPPIVRSTIELPAEAPAAIGIDVSASDFHGPLVAVSGDGAWLAWIAKTNTGRLIYVRDMATGEQRPLPGTEGALGAFFSPDARWIGFLTVDHVSKISRDGGPVTRLCDAVQSEQGWWLTPDVIYFSETEGITLTRVSSDGGTPDRIAGPFATINARGEGYFSDVLDGGRLALSSKLHGISGDRADVTLLDLVSRSSKTLVHGGYAARFVAPDHLIYARAGALYRVRFDPKTGSTSGDPVKIVGDALMESILDISQAAVSSNGVLVFLAGSDLSIGRPAWIDRAGKVAYLDGMPERVYGVVDLSPDDNRLAAEISDVRDFVWVWDLNRREGHKADLEAVKERFPSWSADGRHLAGVTVQRDSTIKMVIHDVEQSGLIGEGRILAGADGSVAAWSPGGDTVIMEAGLRNGQPQLRAGRLTRPDTVGSFEGFFPAFSPDGHWFAYNSLRNGVNDVWLRSFPEGKSAGQISPAGGFEPRWLPSGDLYYRLGNSWWTTRVSTKGDPRWDPPRKVFEMEDFIDTRGWSYDVSRDGQRLLALKRTRPPVRSKIDVITNWTGLLDQKH